VADTDVDKPTPFSIRRVSPPARVGILRKAGFEDARHDG
jgi:hypothetical protein